MVAQKGYSSSAYSLDKLIRHFLWYRKFIGNWGGVNILIMLGLESFHTVYVNPNWIINNTAMDEPKCYESFP